MAPVLEADGDGAAAGEVSERQERLPRAGAHQGRNQHDALGAHRRLRQHELCLQPLAAGRTDLLVLKQSVFG